MITVAVSMNHAYTCPTTCLCRPSSDSYSHDAWPPSRTTYTLTTLHLSVTARTVQSIEQKKTTRTHGLRSLLLEQVVEFKMPLALCPLSFHMTRLMA